MGTCQCQDDNRLSASEVILQQKPKSLTPINQTTAINSPSIIKPNSNMISSRTQNIPHTPVSIIKPPSHEPNLNFAAPIDKFPTLSQKVAEVDQKLGDFKPNSQIMINPDIKPIIIRQPYRLYNGIIYQGEWYNGNMYGLGQFYLPDQSYLKGYSINNQLVGEARYIKQNGNYYQGHIKNNKANGEGILYQNGVCYKGYFVDNYLEGKGIQEAVNYKYQGEYHNGAKTFGILTWDLDKQIPTTYQGAFFDQQFSGEGRLINEVGEYQGRFQNGKKKGRGVFKWKNGDKFEGIYQNNMKNGEGRMFNSKDVVVLQGNWKNDKFVQQS